MPDLYVRKSEFGLLPLLGLFACLGLLYGIYSGWVEERTDIIVTEISRGIEATEERERQNYPCSEAIKRNQVEPNSFDGACMDDTGQRCMYVWLGPDGRCETRGGGNVK